MSVRKKILEKLEKALNPSKLKVVDTSHEHQGHSGWREAGETHFDISVISDKLEGLNRVERHKLIYKILDQEIRQQIHALSIDAKAS